MNINRTTSEEQLIKQAQNGSRLAFERLMSPMIPIIYQYIRSKLHSPEDAEDILQESMLAIWQSIKRYYAASSFQTWCFAIVRHKLSDFYRTALNTNINLEECQSSLTADEQLEEQTENRLLVAELYVAMNETEREIIFLIFQAQLSYQEASQITGIPLGTIKSKMARIKSKLRKHFDAG